jgi:hypothetical protein
MVILNALETEVLLLCFSRISQSTVSLPNQQQQSKNPLIVHRTAVILGASQHSSTRKINLLNSVTQFTSYCIKLDGRDSSVGIATGWRVRDRIPMGAKYLATVQTGPEAHPAFCTVDTMGKATGLWR